MKWRRSDMTSPAFSKRGFSPMRLDRPCGSSGCCPWFFCWFCAGDPLHAAGQKRYGMAGKEAMFLLPALRLYAVVPAAGGGACDRLLLFYFLFVPGRCPLILPGNQPGCAVCRPVSDRAGILVGSLLPNMLASLVINVLHVRTDAGFFLRSFFIC